MGRDKVSGDMREGEKVIWTTLRAHQEENLYFDGPRALRFLCWLHSILWNASPSRQRSENAVGGTDRNLRSLRIAI